jgi:hypothetical protein
MPSESTLRQNQVSNEIWKTIDYLKMEYNIGAAEMIGILELIKLDIYNSHLEPDGE